MLLSVIVGNKEKRVSLENDENHTFIDVIFSFKDCSLIRFLAIIMVHLSLARHVRRHRCCAHVSLARFLQASIGFLGLGNMGKHMATNLIAANHQVSIFDVNPQALDHFKDQSRRTSATALALIRPL